MNVLINLYKKYSGAVPVSCQKIAGSGSNRQYYRLADSDGKTVIGVVGTSLAENATFFYLTDHFAGQGLPVSGILAVSEDRLCYLQTDLGTVSLYDALATGRQSASGYADADVSLLKKAVHLLPRVQVLGARGLDFSMCYPQESMDRENVMFDLNYFKYCFLKTTGTDFDETLLEKDFQRMADDMDSSTSPYFMYRDFQARNLMLSPEGELSLIDYQGGRRGPLQYDLVSFLWQASSHFPDDIRQCLIEEYLEELGKYIDVDKEEFRNSIPRWVLFRTLQVLGAYGLRGRFERKTYFLNSIPAAIGNLSKVLKMEGSCPYPYLREVLDRMLRLPEFAAKDAGSAHKGLHVRVMSFSYKKGLPDDPSGNGGGYVFDCRSTHNPGRYEEYKKLTGMDKPVIDFLEEDGEITAFLDSVYRLADFHVRRYLERGFTSLMFCFGCTGGQHRSVYSAEHLAKHLNERFGVEVSVTHREQGVSYILPERRKAMIFAAGLGTRLRPLTDTMPKALVPVAGRPLIGHVLDGLVSAGFNDIVINVHHFADMLEEWVRKEVDGRADYRECGVRVSFSDERSELLETGGGISHAAGLLATEDPKGRFLVHNVDILSNVNLERMWQAVPEADALLLVSSRKTSRYLVFDDDMRLCGWTNISTGEVRTNSDKVRTALAQRAGDSLDIPGYHLRAFAGIHLLKTSMLKRFSSYPSKFSIIDFYLKECSDATIVGYVQDGLNILDVGKIDTLEEAEHFMETLAGQL